MCQTKMFNLFAPKSANWALNIVLFMLWLKDENIISLFIERFSLCKKNLVKR